MVVFWVCEEAVLGALVFSIYEEVVHTLLCCVLFWRLLFRASLVLQKLLYCGFVKCCLKCEKMFLSLLGIPVKNLNIYVAMFYGENKL